MYWVIQFLQITNIILVIVYIQHQLMWPWYSNNQIREQPEHAVCSDQTHIYANTVTETKFEISVSEISVHYHLQTEVHEFIFLKDGSTNCCIHCCIPPHMFLFLIKYLNIQYYQIQSPHSTHSPAGSICIKSSQFTSLTTISMLSCPVCPPSVHFIWDFLTKSMHEFHVYLVYQFNPS